MITKNKLLFSIMIFIISLIIYYLISSFDHGKYFIDGYKILNTEASGWFFKGSYASTATFLSPLISILHDLNINSYTMQSNKFDFYFVNIIFLSTSTLMIYLVSHKYAYRLNLTYILLVSLMVINYSVFLATVNKEIVYMIFIFPILMMHQIIKFRTFLFLFLIVTFLYALGGRYYFALFALLTILFYNFLYKPKWLSITFLIILLIGFFIFPYVVDIVVIAKPYSIKAYTSTWIDDYFIKTEYFSFLLNSAVNTIRIMFPIELLLKGPKYIFSTIFLSMISWMSLKILFIKNFRDISHNTKLIYFSAITVVSFSIAQSIFEPDFGSVLRHKIGIIFMIMVIINFSSFKSFYLKNNSNTIK